MKPINDDLRKQAYSRAGFFTLIPMLLIGVLVWSGMKNGVVNNDTNCKEIERAKTELKTANEVINSIVSLQGTMEEMFEAREILEEKYKKAFDEDPSRTSDEKSALEENENAIQNFLNIQQKESDTILRTIITQWDTELKLGTRIWTDYTGGSDDEAEMAKLEQENEKLKKENQFLEQKNRDAGPTNSRLENKISQLEGDKEELNSKLGSLKNLIGTHVNQMNGLRIDLGPKIDDIPEIVNKGNDKKISDEERRKVDNLIREIQSTISDMKNKLDLLDSNKSRY